MRTHTRLSAAGILFGLILCVSVVATSRGDDKDKDKPNPAKDPILKLADSLGQNKNIAKDAEELAKNKEMELERVMKLFKVRNSGGVGVYQEVDPKKDGIEQKIRDIGSKKSIPQKELTDRMAELKRMAEIAQVIGEMVPNYPAVKATQPGQGPKEWKQYAEDMKKSTKELTEAIKGGNQMKVKDAANNLTKSCNDCHTNFRDTAGN
jgi:hypothetical protein